MTLEPSMAIRGVERWISSLRDIHASHSPWQAKNKDTETKGTSGQRYSVSLRNVPRHGSSAKTLIAILDPGSKPSEKIWEVLGLRLAQDCLRRQKLALPIVGVDCFFWPTKIKTSEHTNLSQKASKQMWPTPKTPTGGASIKGREGHGGTDLQDVSRHFPPHKTTTTNGHSCSKECRRLNPRFAAWLMGLPPVWTSYVRSAMPSYRWWLRKQSIALRLLLNID